MICHIAPVTQSTPNSRALGRASRLYAATGAISLRALAKDSGTRSVSRGRAPALSRLSDRCALDASNNGARTKKDEDADDDSRTKAPVQPAGQHHESDRSYRHDSDRSCNIPQQRALQPGKRRDDRARSLWISGLRPGRRCDSRNESSEQPPCTKAVNSGRASPLQRGHCASDRASAMERGAAAPWIAG